MASVSDTYVKLLYTRYKYVASWLPNSKVQLGDVGVLDGKYFKRKTSLALLGVEFGKRTGRKPLAFNDDLTAGLHVRVKAAGEVGVGTALPLGEAGVSIAFAQQGAFLFHAVNCYTDEIEDKVAMGKALVALGDKWDVSWSVVDTVVRAGSTTILLANSSEATVELKAKTAIEVSNLAKPELGLELVSKKGDVTQFLAEQGLTPLFQVSRFRRSWIEWLAGKPKTVRFGGSSEQNAEPTVSVLEAAVPDLS